MKYLILLCFKFGLINQIDKPEIRIIKKFNDNILLSKKEFNVEDYKKEIHYYNSCGIKNDLSCDEYFKFIKELVQGFKISVSNANKISICTYDELPINLKNKISFDNIKDLNIYFLIKNKKELIVYYILNNKYEIISFFSNINKNYNKNKININPSYLDR